MGVLKDKILEILQEGPKTFDEIVERLKEHPGVIKLVVKQMEKEGLIKINRKKQHHKSKKFVLEICLA